ncbi:MAG: D-tyrosyl-tRNA(Tyr) deacylase [Spirochaetota bacterium]|jgi:D-tyrosyl-tRNA(Tyr) deacylase|nr:D-tyrosyl-tRNA(Tyr) deacylase [Spirochaetota bacterium]
MRAVVERVTKASVRTGGEPAASMGAGLLVLLGVGKNDAEADAVYLVEKILNLRLFPGAGGDMDASCLEGGDFGVMVVSEFTLYGDCRKGRRPSFSNAADPLRAEELYDYFISLVRNRIGRVCAGRFRTMMEVESINSGPVTILLDSKKEF